MRRTLPALVLLTAPLLACARGMVVAPAPPPIPEGPVQGPAAPPELALEDPLPTDPAVAIGRLENGLSYYVRANAEPEGRAELWLVVNAGSVLEDDDQLGVAHLVEHMAFNGTRRFAEGELTDFLEGIGMQFGPDVNAVTGFDETVYMLRLPAESEILERALDVLEDWAAGVSFAPEALERERGVVIEEWRGRRGAGARIRDRQISLLFQGSLYAERLPIGSPDVLEKIQSEALRRYYRDWYRPDLMALVAVGDFQPEQIVAAIERRFAALPMPENPRPRPLVPVPDHAETLVGIITDPEATVTTVSVFYKLDRRPDATVADYRRLLAEKLYHGMLNQRLSELRRRADPPFLWAFSGGGGFVRSRDVYSQSAGVRPGELLRGLDTLLTEAQRVDRHGFTPGELEREKRELLRQYESAWAERDRSVSAGFAAEYARSFLDGEPIPGIAVELELVRRLLPGLGLEELNRLADGWISDDNRVILVSAPDNEADALPDRDQLLAAFRAAEDRPVEPYLDDVPEGPLVAEAPPRGVVVEIRERPELGITEWRLANGVRVVLKPTEFRNDQVLMTGFSPGGHSLAPDDAFVSASFAAVLVGESGAGRLNRSQLEKALAGKLISVRPYISALEEGISAGGSPRDLETLFELLYLSLTAPRLDEDAFTAFKTRTEAVLRNRLAQPEAVFADQLTRTLTQDHPRTRPLTPATLEAIDPAAALDFYRRRFADASDFTFVMVGSFEPEAVRPLVETWLGALPAEGREESWVDRGVHAPDGLATFEVRKGLEPKSEVVTVYHGAASWGRAEIHRLRSLTAALRIRLRELLREELGATYDVDVSGSLLARPRQRYRLQISFGCDPERVDELLLRISDELEAVRREGFSESTLANVREQQRREREVDLRQNSFWAGALGFHYRHDLDPGMILDYGSLVDGLTNEALRAAAEHYLDPNQYVRGILYPETSADDSGGG